MLHFKPSNNENQRFTKRWIFEDLTIWWYPLTAFTTTWGYPRLTFLRAMRGSYWASLRTETQRFIRNLGAGWVYWNIILIFFAHRHYNCEVFLFVFFYLDIRKICMCKTDMTYSDVASLLSAPNAVLFLAVTWKREWSFAAKGWIRNSEPGFLSLYFGVGSKWHSPRLICTVRDAELNRIVHPGPGE